MKLSNYDINIGDVVNVDDPDHHNKIQCAIPNTSDPRNENINEYTMIWARPFSMNGYQTFSRVQKNSKVWVLQNLENSEECWYINFFEYTDSLAEYVDNNMDAHPEVLFLRKNLNNTAQISYDDNNGIQIGNGNTFINVKDDGTVHIGNDKGGITIDGNNIYIGSNASEGTPPVRADKLIELLNKMSEKFQLLSTACNTGWLAGLKPAFMDLQEMTAESYTKPIEAKNTTVS